MSLFIPEKVLFDDFVGPNAISESSDGQYIRNPKASTSNSNVVLGIDPLDCLISLKITSKNKNSHFSIHHGSLCYYLSNELVFLPNSGSRFLNSGKIYYEEKCEILPFRFNFDVQIQVLLSNGICYLFQGSEGIAVESSNFFLLIKNAEATFTMNKITPQDAIQLISSKSIVAVLKESPLST